MKTEDEIKKAMDNVKLQLTRSDEKGTLILQGQYASLEWVLGEEDKNE